MLWKQFSSEDEAEVLAGLGSSREGLEVEAAARRLTEVGANRIDDEHGFWLKLIRRRVKSTFLYLLVAAAGLSFLLGDRIGAGLITLFLVINISLETYQEFHSEKAVQLLRRYLVTLVRVRRGRAIVSVESGTLVPGDIVIVQAGDRLSADVRLLETTALTLDESIITGESLPVEKSVRTPAHPPAEMNEAGNIAFAGTVAMSGRGEGVVFATGRRTALGDIAQLTGETERETVFEKGIAQFSRFIMKMVVFTIAIIFVANLFIKGGSIDPIELFIFSLVLIVSVIPEALPVILTVSLSRGSLRLAQKKVVVKRLSAIEDLGSIEVLCTDKTGTLTENVLSVRMVRAADKRQCLQLAFAACEAEPTDRGKLSDAFDLALWQALHAPERDAAKRLHRIAGIPFDPERRRSSVLVEHGRTREIVVRGAPEEVFQVSRNIDALERKELDRFIAEAGRSGARVLAVARRPYPSGQTYTPYDEQALELVGLIAFADTVKATARETLRKAKELNVEIKLISGDSREAAGAVGFAVGLIDNPAHVVTGKELDALGYDEKRRVVFAQSVFARISPQQKFTIIKLLQEKKEVGFLGDGINDAPALKLANVALVVQGASDIAREAADVVLLQKNLGTVVDGIREGRIIFANILKYLRITLTSNFGNFYSVALASLFLPFVPLLPIQMLLIDLLSDFPMIAIATDSVDTEELETPKNYHVHSIVLMATLLGVVSSFFDFMLFGLFARSSPAVLQTAWFVLSAMTEVVLIFSLRTKRPFFRARHAPALLMILAFFVLGIVIVLPFTVFGHTALHFVRPTPAFIAIILSLVAGYFFATETVKQLYFRHFATGRRRPGQAGRLTADGADV